jgi:hypothetical protein
MKKMMKKAGLLLALAVGFVLGARSGQKPYEMFKAQVRRFIGQPRIQAGNSRAIESVEVIHVTVQDVDEIGSEGTDLLAATASAYDRLMTEKSKAVADVVLESVNDDDGDVKEIIEELGTSTREAGESEMPQMPAAKSAATEQVSDSGDGQAH